MTADISKRDIVAFIVRNVDPSLTGREEITTEDIKRLLSTPVSQVVDLSGRNPWVTVNKNAPLMSAIQLVSAPTSHHVYVTGDFGRPIGVISQMDVLQFLLKNREHFRAQMDAKIEDIWPGKSLQ